MFELYKMKYIIIMAQLVYPLTGTFFVPACYVGSNGLYCNYCQLDTLTAGIFPLNNHKSD